MIISEYKYNLGNFGNIIIFHMMLTNILLHLKDIPA